MVSISVLSFTHLGYRKDLKSEPTYWTIKKLADNNMINKAFLLDVEDTFDISPDLFETPIPGGKTIPRIFYLFESMSPFPIDARNINIKLLDLMAASRVGNEDILHSFPFFGKSLRQAKKDGVTTAVYAGGGHPNFTRKLLKTEVEEYGFEVDISERDFEIQAQSYQQADYLLTLSSPQTETFLDQGFAEDQIFNVGPLGVDLDYYQPTSRPQNEFNVLCVADVTPLKGVQYLIEAWKQLDLDAGNLKIVGQMSEDAENWIQPLIDSDPSITHIDHVADVQPYYSEASVFVQPSLTEGFSKVIAEAMASELPVIITENCQREFIDDAGFVVPIRDPEAIATKISHLYELPEKADLMGKRGREIVTEHTWSDFSERIMHAHYKIAKQEGYNV